MKEERARVWLLGKIRQRVVVAHAAEEDVLTLYQQDFEHFGGEMGRWTTREVSALYKRLVLGGYPRQVRDETGFLEINGVIQRSSRGFLSGDSSEKLLASMDALLEAKESSSEGGLG
jgi:hypothetical protein